MIDKYKQGYIEEASDLLAEMESALLQLDQKHDDADAVSRAFRALHTIKGSGAMFGFDDIARFTHNLETAFDQLRKGQIAPTPELIKLTLAAGDQIKAMLDEADGRASADPTRSAGILAELSQLTGAVADQTGLFQCLPAGAKAIDNGSTQSWEIHFRPGPSILSNGMNPVLLLREVRSLGELRIEIDAAAIPPLEEIQPQRSYFAWKMVLTTTQSLDEIRDVFVFFEDDSELTIAHVAGPPEEARPSPASKSGREARSVAGNGAVSSLRVSAEKLDQLVNLVGELVTVQACLSEIATKKDDPDILAISEDIDRLTAALRENSMSIRMLPLRSTFERFHRLVHDLGTSLQKDVELVIEGGDTELDKTVIDQLNDPLVHLIRNSMDHGIETREGRRAAGKRPLAKIRLSALHSGANVLIRVSDDGRGLNADSVLARAVEQGLIDAGTQASESEILSLIWAPGFSTTREVSDVSGRGVGMDVVRRSVEALRGTVELNNKLGEGLCITLRLPLTLAIIDGLLVRVGQSHFVLPLANSLECVELTDQDIHASNGNAIANVRGQLIPYIRLRDYFEMRTERPKCEQVMVVETEYGHYGFVVDEVLGDHQTVIKNLGNLYRNVQGLSGATILGDGTVALILDPPRLVQNIVQTMSPGRQKSPLTIETTRREKTTHVS
jgi:two-component system chemotaxis sensor kinase CheA